MNDKYLQYDSIEFAADPVFIRWVQSGFKENEPKWNNFIGQHPELKQKVEDAILMVNSIQFRDEELSTDKKALWDRIDSSIEDRDKTLLRIVSRNRLYIGISAVAASIALVLFFVFGMGQMTSTVADMAESLAVVLPDQSSATLNSGSLIKFNERKWPEDRSLWLKGEAFFEVEKGSSFTVNTSKGSVEVLGTKFNVYARKDGFSVECISGKVQVKTSNSKEAVLLVKGEESVMLGNGKLLKSSMNQADEIDWLVNLSRFENAKLASVFDEFERQFDVRISANRSIREKLYTGFFVHQSQEEALEDICWPMKLKAEQKGNKIVISEDLLLTE